MSRKMCSDAPFHAHTLLLHLLTARYSEAGACDRGEEQDVTAQTKAEGDTYLTDVKLIQFVRLLLKTSYSTQSLKCELQVVSLFRSEVSHHTQNALNTSESLKVRV